LDIDQAVGSEGSSQRCQDRSDELQEGYGGSGPGLSSGKGSSKGQEGVRQGFLVVQRKILMV
jgi:hypothetical protein